MYHKVLIIRVYACFVMLYGTALRLYWYFTAHNL